jgi:hypothetical protein
MSAIMRDLCDRDPDWVFRRLLREVRVWLEEERARLSWLRRTPSPTHKVRERRPAQKAESFQTIS